MILMQFVKMRFVRSVFAIIYWSILGIMPAHADFVIHTWDDQFDPDRRTNFQLSPLYYSSSNPALFHRFEMDLTLKHPFTENLQFYGRFAWAHSQYELENLTLSGEDLADQTLGLSYRLSPLVNLQIQIDFPGYKNPFETRPLILGDGSIDSTIGFFSLIPIYAEKSHLFQTSLGAGMTFRNLGFSNAIPWSAGIQYNYRNTGFFTALSLKGIQSLQTHSEELSLTGLNPTLVQLNAKIGVKFPSGTELSLTANQSLAAQNAPEGFTFGAGLKFYFGSERVCHFNNQQNYWNNQNSLESKVLETNDRLSLVKIDKGSQDGIEMGQIFDIYSVDKSGNQALSTEFGPHGAIARGQILSVKPDQAVLEIKEYFKEKWIEKGFLAKRPFQ